MLAALIVALSGPRHCSAAATARSRLTNLALRQQLAVLDAQRETSSAAPPDWLFWVLLANTWRVGATP